MRFVKKCDEARYRVKLKRLIRIEGYKSKDITDLSTIDLERLIECFTNLNITHKKQKNEPKTSMVKIK